MEIKIFLAIVFSAFLHAIWNAMVKKEDDKYISLTALVLGHTPISVVVILLTPLPAIQSMPYIFISAIFLTGYEWCLLSAYRLEDLTKVYPIARGFGPLVATIISILILLVSLCLF